MTAWRIRRCPSCRSAFPAGQLGVVNFGAHWGQEGRALRQCPKCGHRAPTSSFGVVHERHGAPTTGAPR